MALDSGELWDPELKDLNCQESFYKIRPLYNDFSRFYTLTDTEQKAVEYFDKYLFEWGENFDDWTLLVIVRGSICKFLYVHTSNRDNDTYEVKNEISCFNVNKEEVQLAYSELCMLIPERYWPVMIKRI